jgi:hypothetical protein
MPKCMGANQVLPRVSEKPNKAVLRVSKNEHERGKGIVCHKNREKETRCQSEEASRVLIGQNNRVNKIKKQSAYSTNNDNKQTDSNRKTETLNSKKQSRKGRSNV